MQKVEDIVTSNPKWNAKTELTFSREGNASSQLFESGVRGGGGGAAEEVSTSTRGGCAGPRAIRLTASHPHHQPAVAPKPVAAAEEEEVCVCVAALRAWCRPCAMCCAGRLTTTPSTL